MGIVIPAFNEASRIGGVLRSLSSQPIAGARLTPIVVDDGSTDRTREVAREVGAVVVRHPVNLGYGSALWTGTDAAFELGMEIIVHLDADGQHDPRDLPRLLDALHRGADAATGRRRLAAPMPLFYILGNRVITTAMRLLFGITHPDSQCGYRAFWARCWPQLKWRSRDYAISSEILVLAKRQGLRMASVPVETIYHEKYKGTGVADGIGIMSKLVWWRLHRIGPIHDRAALPVQTVRE